MKKEVYGICPKDNEKTVIVVDYLDAYTFNGTQYCKGLFECEKRKEYNCKSGTCSIFENAPENIK